MPVDTREVYGYDALRRVNGTIYSFPELKATATQALVFSLHFEGKGANFVPTQSTRLKWSRLDNLGSEYTSYVFLRKTNEQLTTPQVVIDSSNSDYYPADVTAFSRIAQAAPATIMNTSKEGINGWVLAAVSYKVARQQTGEIFQDIKIPFGDYLGNSSTHELALIIDTASASEVVASVHFDFVETN